MIEAAENAPVDGRVTGSAIRRIVSVIAAIGMFLTFNALLVGGGGAIEAGADGLLTPGYSRSKSEFVLVIGIVAWLALALIVIVLVRKNKNRVRALAQDNPAARIQNSQERSVSAIDGSEPAELGQGQSLPQ